MSGNEMAKLHIRHMVGGHAPRQDMQERLFRVEFPERPGALMKFLQSLGEKWNINGRRTWEWSDDGVKYNGWIQFCAGGVLRTPLCPEGRGTWSFEEQSSFIVRSEMTVTFGNVMYVLVLISKSPGCFRVISCWVTGVVLIVRRS